MKKEYKKREAAVAVPLVKQQHELMHLGKTALENYWTDIISFPSSPTCVPK
jgi:hypothetical protein